MKPRITFTGVDESVTTSALYELSSFAEIGFLFTLTPEGRKRYPTMDWIQKNMRYVAWAALHVCGRGARQMLLDPKNYELFKRFARIQINGVVTEEELSQACKLFPTVSIITQHAGNEALLPLEIENHSILVDSSGGRGISPAEWVKLPTEKRVGFAGGLGPDNIATELARIQQVANAGYWVDMESKLRDEMDFFSPCLAENVLKEINHDALLPTENMLPIQTLFWKDWWEALKKLAEPYYGILEEPDRHDAQDGWRMYWRDGYTPQDALDDDLSYA
jgi:phosphoribosylanthranilate isomerase